jgi:type II secretory pathway pseudopilin PulG
MTTTKRTNEALWQKVKAELLRKNGGHWDARLAQRCVQEYRRSGGEYIGKKDPENSLSKWTRESWGYVKDDPTGRYLPKAVRSQLTPSQAREENRRKRAVGKGHKAPYGESLNALMKKNGIY